MGAHIEGKDGRIITKEEAFSEVEEHADMNRRMSNSHTS